jgi:hypothetical protein
MQENLATLSKEGQILFKLGNTFQRINIKKLTKCPEGIMVISHVMP